MQPFVLPSIVRLCVHFAATCRALCCLKHPPSLVSDSLGRMPAPQADRVEQLGDGVIVTTTPLGTRTSGASRGRGFFIRNEHRDELVGWLKTRGADLKHVTLHAIKGKKAGNFGSLFCGVFFICERTTALTRSPKIGMY
eukprot:s6381_g1.t7